MQVLTTSGYVDAADLQVGAQLPAWDLNTGQPIVNTLLAIERLTPERYAYAVPNVIDPENIPDEIVVPEFTYYLVNGTLRLFKDQSIWVAPDVVKHASDLVVGDTIYDEHDQPVTITSISTYEGLVWYRLIVSGDHSYIADGLTLHNADRFWVGGTDNWNATNGTKWAATDGGAGGSTQPTASDDAKFTALSGAVTVTVSSNGRTCRDRNFTGFTGTFTGSSSMLISGSDILSAGMTMTYNGATTFNATTTGFTLTTAGKTRSANITFNGVGGGWTFADDFTSNGTVVLTNGALDTGGKAVKSASFNCNNPNTKSFTFASNTWEVTASGTPWILNPNGSTFVSGGTIKVTDASASSLNVGFGGADFGSSDVQVTASSGALSLTGANSIINRLILTGYTGQCSPAQGYTMRGDVVLGTGMSFASAAGSFNMSPLTGTTTLTSNGVSLDRGFTVNAPGATVQLADDFLSIQPLTLTAGTLDANNKNVTCATFVSNNSNVRTLTLGSGTWDITSDGAASQFIWSITPGTNLTVTPSTATIKFSANTSNTRTLRNNPADLSGTTFLVSAGSGNIVIVQNTSNTLGSVVFDDAFTGTWVTGNAFNFTGDITLSANMQNPTVANVVTAVGSGVQTITSKGKVMTGAFSVTCSGTGTVRLADNFSAGGSLTLNTGAFDANDKDVTSARFLSFNANPGRALNMGSGTWTLTTETLAPWQLGEGSNDPDQSGLAINAGTSTIALTGNYATAQHFNGNGKVYHNIYRPYVPGSAALVITAGNGDVAFNEVRADPGASLYFHASPSTISANVWAVSGVEGLPVSLNVDDGTTTQANLSATGDLPVELDYVDVQNTNVSPAGQWRAGENSVDSGNNTGWFFGHEVTDEDRDWANALEQPFKYQRTYPADGALSGAGAKMQGSAETIRTGQNKSTAELILRMSI